MSGGGSGVTRVSPRPSISNATRLLQVYVKDTHISSEPVLRGRVSLHDRLTILALRTEVMESMLDDAERVRVPTVEQLSLKIGGRVPVRAAQNALSALSLLTPEDSDIVVELPTSSS